MPDSDKPEIGEEAKGVAHDFLDTLGIVNLITGGLVLYWAKLSFGDVIAKDLPTSGFPVIDIALLTCAAALVGISVALFVVFIMAVVETVIQRRNVLNYTNLMSTALTDYREKLGFTVPLAGTDEIELAAMHVSAADPGMRSSLERVRTDTSLSYSITLVAVLFAIYMIDQKTPWWIAAGAIVSVIVFAIRGFLLQLDYVLRLRMCLQVLRERVDLKPPAAA